MGRGIVHPVDEMNSKNKPSHPELLEWLSTDFATHNYDIRRLVRAIVLSRGYQLAGCNPCPTSEAFAAAAERPLTAEAIVRSARLVSGRTGDDGELRKAVLECFPEVLPRVTRATIQQAMFLAGSERLSQNFKPDPGTTAERLGNLSAFEARVREAFRAALIREPDDAELVRAIEFLKAASDTPGEAAGQLLWTLVTGSEFLTNH